MGVVATWKGGNSTAGESCTRRRASKAQDRREQQSNVCEQGMSKAQMDKGLPIRQ